MANTTLKSRIVLLNKTSVEWGSEDTVLLKGELALEFTKSNDVKLKFGDGTKTFSQLPYSTMTPTEIQSAISSAVSEASHTHENLEILNQITAAFTSELKSKYDATSSKVDGIAEWALAPSKPTYTADEVGADAKGSASAAESNAKSYTDSVIEDLVGTAPETLDTIHELAEAIQTEQSAVDAIESSITNKVDKVEGKGLSTNDLTNELKADYDAAVTHSESDHAPANAQENIIEEIQIGGVKQEPSDKKVNLPAYPTTLPASDVYDWAKEETKPTYTKDEIGLSNVDNTADVNKVVASAGKFTTARNVQVSGAVTADPVAFDGSTDLNLVTKSVDAAKLVINEGDVLILDGSF